MHELFCMNMNVTKYIYLFLGFLFFIPLSCSKTTDPGPGDTVSDIDGYVYRTIKIGTQTWMGENLNTSHYNDGTAIPGNLNDYEWESATTGAYAVFGAEDVYGKLYNGYAVLTEKLCPAGWHIATHDEWLTLENYLGGADVAGGKLKYTEIWERPNFATNSSGFSALGAGMRQTTGFYTGLNFTTLFWTPGKTVPLGLRFHYMGNANEKVAFNVVSSNYGFSCRCIKD